MIFISESTQRKQDPPRYHLRVFEVHDTTIKWIYREHVKVERVIHLSDRNERQGDVSIPRC